MKTKKLIELLQEADPSGERECVVGNHDILDVSAEPGYWDGAYEVLIREEENPFYNVIGAKITTKGIKVVINTLSIKSAIWESDSYGEHFPVEIDTTYVRPESNQRYHDLVEKWRVKPRKYYESKKGKKS